MKPKIEAYFTCQSLIWLKNNHSELDHKTHDVFQFYFFIFRCQNFEEKNWFLHFFLIFFLSGRQTRSQPRETKQIIFSYFYNPPFFIDSSSICHKIEPKIALSMKYRYIDKSILVICVHTKVKRCFFKLECSKKNLFENGSSA